jgi:rhodanese-related sulfurtransferase
MSNETTPPAAGLALELRLALRQALAILALSAIFALLVNMVRPDGLKLVADKPYETLVPCPESGGPITALAPDQARADLAASFFVDARDLAAWVAGHQPGAVSIPYDYLEPTSPELIKALAQNILKSGKRRVVVYGDGDAADAGVQLAKEISAAGIKNVYFVHGGAPALFGGSPSPGGTP